MENQFRKVKQNLVSTGYIPGLHNRHDYTEDHPSRRQDGKDNQRARTIENLKGRNEKGHNVTFGAYVFLDPSSTMGPVTHESPTVPSLTPWQMADYGFRQFKSELPQMQVRLDGGLI